MLNTRIKVLYADDEGRATIQSRIRHNSTDFVPKPKLVPIKMASIANSPNQEILNMVIHLETAAK